MELIIKNLGSIKNVKIALDKKFYVFVGYNNTGKTYLSQILWSLFDNEIYNNFIKIHSYEELVLTNGQFKLETTIVRKVVNDFAKYFKSYVIPSIFNIAKDHFILKDAQVNFKYTFSQIKKKKVEVSGGIILNDKTKKNNSRIELYKADKKENSNIIKLSIFDKSNENKEFDDIKDKVINVNEILLNTIIRTLLPSNNGFYLPASRLFYPVFYQYIYKVEKEKREEMSKKLLDILEQKDRSKLDIKSLTSFRSQYTKPMDELFGKLYKLNENDTIKKTYIQLINNIKSLIGGDIILKKAEGVSPIEFQLDLGEQKHLDMYLSSSSINQLTTLLLYLKHWVYDNNNFLLVDEPEENLHPENQEKLIHILLKFAAINKNKVLITTHSPLITNVINNFLNIGYLKEKKDFNLKKFLAENKLDFEIKDILFKKDFGVYFFSGSDVIEYSAKEYGVYFEDFDKIDNKIKNLSENITDEIYQHSEL